jgi:hypothetical protein
MEGFGKTFTDTLLNKKISTDNKHYSISNFKNLIEAISAVDMDKFSDINSILVSVMTEILKIPNSNFYLFGFIDQNEKSILESTITLEIMNKFKTLNIEYFFDVVQEMKIENSNIGIKYSKDEFHIIEMIFSEILHYIEKSFLKKIRKRFDENFYKNIKDLQQYEKFQFLEDFLQNMNYSFESNSILKKSINTVLTFFTNRSTWKKLYRVKDDIIKLNLNFKTIGCETHESFQNSINETEELKVRLYYIVDHSQYIEDCKEC